MGGSLSPQQWLRVGLLAAAFALTLISVFTPWWTIFVQSGATTDDSSVRPYAAGNLADEGDRDGLGGEALLTGIFVTMALGGVTALLGVELLPLAGKSLPPIVKLVGAGVAVVFGLVALIYTATAWPPEATRGGAEMGFYDSRHIEGFSGFGVDTPDTDISTYAGVGWYLAIVGTILLPAGAIVYGIVIAAPSAALPAQRPPAPPPSPRRAEPVYAPAAPLGTPKLREVRATATRAAPRRK